MTGYRGDMEARIESPDKIRVAVTITLPLEDWKRLREQLEGVAFPASWVRSAVASTTKRLEGRVIETFDPQETP